MKTKKEQIAKIVKYFDWEKVHKTMVLLDWKWGHRPTKIPDIPELQRCAVGLMEQLGTFAPPLKGIVSSVASGGFRANLDKEDGTIILEFVLTEWEEGVE